MSIGDIANGLYIVLIVVLGFVSIYYKTNQKLKDNVTDFINQAENEYKDVTKAGGLKFDWCVRNLYSLVPAAIKPFISKEMIEILVQKGFDIMENYAKNQLDKVLGTEPEKVETVSEESKS
jgi:hypothetical protein